MGLTPALPVQQFPLEAAHSCLSRTLFGRLSLAWFATQSLLVGANPRGSRETGADGELRAHRHRPSQPALTAPPQFDFPPVITRTGTR